MSHGACAFLVGRLCFSNELSATNGLDATSNPTHHTLCCFSWAPAAHRHQRRWSQRKLSSQETKTVTAKAGSDARLDALPCHMAVFSARLDARGSLSSETLPSVPVSFRISDPTIKNENISYCSIVFNRDFLVLLNSWAIYKCRPTAHGSFHSCRLVA